MKILLYQYFDPPINFNKNYWDYSISSIKKYAEKIDVEYEFISGGAPYHPQYGILIPFIERWCDDYDLLIYVDCDILATSNSKNIVEYVNFENININHMNTGPLIVDPIESQSPWFEDGHANSGVVVFPKKIYLDFINYLGNLKHHWARDKLNGNFNAPNTFGGGDQQILNMYAKENNRKLSNLHYDFNFHMSRYDQSQRFCSSLIHYHGGLSKRRNNNNRKLMIEDYFCDKILK